MPPVFFGHQVVAGNPLRIPAAHLKGLFYVTINNVRWLKAMIGIDQFGGKVRIFLLRITHGLLVVLYQRIAGVVARGVIQIVQANAEERAQFYVLNTIFGQRSEGRPKKVAEDRLVAHEAPYALKARLKLLPYVYSRPVHPSIEGQEVVERIGEVRNGFVERPYTIEAVRHHGGFEKIELSFNKGRVPLLPKHVTVRRGESRFHYPAQVTGRAGVQV